MIAIMVSPWAAEDDLGASLSFDELPVTKGTFGGFQLRIHSWQLTYSLPAGTFRVDDFANFPFGGIC